MQEKIKKIEDTHAKKEVFMSVANLTRYENLLIGDLSDEREMIECTTGTYVKFEEAVEAVEASSNSLQQLQAKIHTVISRIDVAVEKCDGSYSRVDIANELRDTIGGSNGLYGG